MTEGKVYEVEGLEFEFSPDGSPFAGLLTVTGPEGTFGSKVDLTKLGSRAIWAKEAAELYGMDVLWLKRSLNELCTLRIGEVAAAEEAEHEEVESESEPLSEEAEELVARPGVLNRYVEDVARIHGVVKDRNPLRLQTLVTVGAQLTPLPNGKPAGANLMLTAQTGRGKNYICDAVAVALPEEFYFAFESASAKSLYYRAEDDPAMLKHRWIYPSEAEAMDKLVEMLRPLLSGGKASHLTVNTTGEGRSAAQELNVEGPASVTIPTVRNKLDVQLQTRMLVAELPDYEGRVAEHSREVSRQLLPDYAGEDHGPKIHAWQSALWSLTAVRRVVFPLDREEFCFGSDEVSHGSRLWGNLLGLMLAHAWLEQKSRQIVKLLSGERAVMATPEDYEAAYEVFKATCERSIVNLSDTHRKILDAVHELKQEGSLTEGYSLRRIAERADVHHSTVAEHKTYLTKSARLLREAEGGCLDLVAGAEPSWWRKGDVLVGFPRPEQVKGWWAEQGLRSESQSTRQARQPQVDVENGLGYAENAVGHPTRHPSDSTRQTAAAERVSGLPNEVSGSLPDSKNGIDKRKTADRKQVSGLSSAFSGPEKELIITALDQLFESRPEARHDPPAKIARDLWLWCDFVDEEPPVKLVEKALAEENA